MIPLLLKQCFIGNQDKLLVDLLSEHLKKLHATLGIPHDYASHCGLPLFKECETLVEISPDMFGRPCYIHEVAYKPWLELKQNALSEGIDLQVVSAFRGFEYQADLLRKKLENGQTIDAILKVNTAPGFSEHHAGTALDLSTPGYEPLSTSFEQSPAFTWLQQHASSTGFFMSYPQGNPYGISYEPWHWCFKI